MVRSSFSTHSFDLVAHERRVVSQQFKRSWRHTTGCPKVRAVYKIVPTQQNVDKYNAYRYVVALPLPSV